MREVVLCKTFFFVLARAVAAWSGSIAQNHLFLLNNLCAILKRFSQQVFFELNCQKVDGCFFSIFAPLFHSTCDSKISLWMGILSV